MSKSLINHAPPVGGQAEVVYEEVNGEQVAVPPSTLANRVVVEAVAPVAPAPVAPVAPATNKA